MLRLIYILHYACLFFVKIYLLDLLANAAVINKYDSYKEFQVLDDEEIEGLRVACKLGREVLDEAAQMCAPGITTDDIDKVVHEACIERDCYPSPLGCCIQLFKFEAYAFSTRLFFS